MIGIDIDRCCDCGFNEHDQYWPHESFDSYLGYNFHENRYPGPPMLICLYDPEKDFRDNIRQIGWNHPRTICIAGDSKYKGEFEKQLNGFPDWCPLQRKGDTP